MNAPAPSRVTAQDFSKLSVKEVSLNPVGQRAALTAGQERQGSRLGEAEGRERISLTEVGDSAFPVVSVLAKSRSCVRIRSACY
jgi:hypothetical protein